MKKQTKQKDEKPEDTKLKYQLYDIVVRGLVKNSELSAKGFKELLDFVRQTEKQAREEALREVLKEVKEINKTCEWARCNSAKKLIVLLEDLLTP